MNANLLNIVTMTKKSKGNFRNNGYFSNAGVANGKTHFEKN